MSVKEDFVRQTLKGKDPSLIRRGALRKAIPDICFQVSHFWAFFYMLRDYACIFATFFAYKHFLDTYVLSTAALCATYFIYYYLQGFFMWCMFVVGHDCGHGTFSTSPFVNFMIGHVTHGSILVPFSPWALSHKRHHMFHNDKKRDYSNPWHRVGGRGDAQLDYIRPILPFFAWFIYLVVGFADGTHFFPSPFGRLYRNASWKDRFACIFSACTVFGYIAFYKWYFESWSNVAFYVLGPWNGFGWWLFTVTYFQHHYDESTVFAKDMFDFEYAAFETVDRSYGKFIDNFHHRITDCHVIHHLFSTKIPHYRLREANDGMLAYMKENEIDHIYKFESCRDFFVRIWIEFARRGFTYHEYVRKENVEDLIKKED